LVDARAVLLAVDAPLSGRATVIAVEHAGANKRTRRLIKEPESSKTSTMSSSGTSVDGSRLPL